MAYKNYTNTFYSEKNNRWDIEIWSQSDTSTGNIFTTGKGGFKLSYKGSDSRRDITMPSEMTMQFIIKDADDQTFITTLFEADDNEYFVLIRRNFVIFWWGNLNAGFDSLENDYYPYEVTLKANDFIGEVINRKDYVDIPDDPIITIGELTGNQILSRSNIGSNGFLTDAFPFGIQEKIIRLNTRWTAPNQISYNNDFNPFSINRINVGGFEANANEVGKYYPANAFKEILKAYGLKAFQSEGKVNIIQPYSYIDNTINVKKVRSDASDTLTPVAYEDIDNRQNAENDTTVAPTIDSGFRGTEWLQNPADFTTWSAQGSVTSITSNSFNIALTTSYLYVSLTEGDYHVSFSQNLANTQIVYANTSGADNILLTESGGANFQIGASGGRLKIMATTTGTKTVEFIGLQKGNLTNRRFLGGQRWRYQRPISSVTANFNYGVSVAQATSNFPIGIDTTVVQSQYTTLSNIGAFSTAAADQIMMNMNVFYAEKFDYLSAADNFTHIGGTLTLKLKLGSLYLSGDTEGDLSWSGSDSTFTVPVPIAEIDTSYIGNFLVQTLQEDAQTFYPNENTAPFFTGTGSLGMIGVNKQVYLPSAASGGSVDLQFVSAVVNYYINPDTSDPSSPPTPLTPVKNNLSTKWFTGSNAAGSYMPVMNFSLSFSSPESSASGIQFSASTGLDNYQTEEFGTLNLGITGDENSWLNCIQIVSNTGAMVVPDYLQVNNTGTQYNMTSLLLEEYLEPQIEPLKILEGSYYVNDFSAFKCIVLDGEKYVFFEGTLTADSDTMAGNWYKLATSTQTITTVDDTIVYPDPPPPSPPNPHDPTGDQSMEKAMFNAHLYNSIGVSSTAINLVQTDKVYLLNNPRCSLYDDQKLVLTRPDLTQPIILTKDGASTTSSGYIEVDAFTPDVIYPIGSILSILTYDLTNVITAGTSTPNLYQGVTTTEIYLSPDKFITPSTANFHMYSRDDLGSIQQSSYTRGNKAFASTFIPVGYKITHVLISCNQNRGIEVLTGTTTNDTTTSLYTGNANTPIPFGTPYVSVLGTYVILELTFQSSTDEIYGAKITIAAV